MAPNGDWEEHVSTWGKWYPITVSYLSCGSGGDLFVCLYLLFFERCVPKKIMHYTALLGAAMQDALNLGWNIDMQRDKHTPSHDWCVFI